MDWDTKVRSVESLRKYVPIEEHPHDIAGDEFKPFRLTCFCKKRGGDGKAFISPSFSNPNNEVFLIVLHHILADHKPLQRCILCGVVLLEDFLLLHLSHDCDDSKASQKYANKSAASK